MIANIPLNPGTPFSGVENSVAVAVGDGVIDVCVKGTGVAIGVGVEVGGVDIGVTDGEAIGVGVIDLLIDENTMTGFNLCISKNRSLS